MTSPSKKRTQTFGPRAPSPAGRCGMEKKVGTTTDVDEMVSCRDWSDLPLDALASIFSKLDAIEILMGTGLVCHSWLQAAKLPELWRSVDMVHHKLDVVDDEDDAWPMADINCDVLCAMARVAVDRSCGQLEVFLGKLFVTDELLKYIADRSPALKVVSLISCHDASNKGFTEMITMCPMLEEINLQYCHKVAGRDIYQATGKACALLKRFTLRMSPYIISRGEEAVGVAAMHELRSLTLTNCNVTNEGLAAILDGCPHLELLDLRGCFNIVIDDALKARCAAIKSLILPNRVVPQEDIENYECDGDWESD